MAPSYSPPSSASSCQAVSKEPGETLPHPRREVAAVREVKLPAAWPPHPTAALPEERSGQASPFCPSPAAPSPAPTSAELSSPSAPRASKWRREASAAPRPLAYLPPSLPPSFPPSPHGPLPSRPPPRLFPPRVAPVGGCPLAAARDLLSLPRPGNRPLSSPACRWPPAGGGWGPACRFAGRPRAGGPRHDGGTVLDLRWLLLLLGG